MLQIVSIRFLGPYSLKSKEAADVVKSVPLDALSADRTEETVHPVPDHQDALPPPGGHAVEVEGHGRVGRDGCECHFEGATNKRIEIHNNYSI